MPAVTLTPTFLTPDSGNVDLTTTFTGLSLLGAGNSPIQWGNIPGAHLLFLQCTGSTSTVTVNIGSTVLGQAVTAFAPFSPTVGDIVMVGPFHTVMENPAGLVQVALGTPANVKALLVQVTGVY
jgi:hypothetical protein